MALRLNLPITPTACAVHYNFYLYAYDKDAQREHAMLKGRKEPEQQQIAKPKIKRNEMER